MERQLNVVTAFCAFGIRTAHARYRSESRQPGAKASLETENGQRQWRDRQVASLLREPDLVIEDRAL
jgi:hypothetical protein